jgi:hypothetical protein
VERILAMIEELKAAKEKFIEDEQKAQVINFVITK